MNNSHKQTSFCEQHSPCEQNLHGKQNSSVTRVFFLRLILIFLNVVLALRYRLKIKGLKEIEALMRESGRPCLFLPNHPALIDPIILYRVLGAGFRPRPLSDESQANRPFLGYIFKKIIKVIEIADVAKEGKNARAAIDAALQRVANALAFGESVMLYPSGNIYREQNERLGANSGLVTVLQKIRQSSGVEPHLVVVRTSGLWGSRFSRASGRYPLVADILKKAMLALVANFLFFIPKREVSMEFSLQPEFDKLCKLGDTLTINRYLEDYYNEVSQPATEVPLFFWQGSVRRPLPRGGGQGNALQSVAVTPSEAVWQQIGGFISELSGVASVDKNMNLLTDLGLDSLAIAELSVWLEGEFGHSVPEPASLVSVQDVINAAYGQMEGGAAPERLVPDKWFLGAESGKGKELGLADCQEFKGTSSPNLAALFIRKMREDGAAPLVFDYLSGLKTRQNVLLEVTVLQSLFTKFEGERLGLMLPASRAALSCYFATLLAGKVPVMLNWTMGSGNLKHCLNLSETQIVVTSKAFILRLERQGFDKNSITNLNGDPVKWLYLEDMVSSLSLPHKIWLLLRSRFCRRLDNIAKNSGESGKQEKGLRGKTKGVPFIAAILFTSGSEAAPKAVPLSHANIISNLKDVADILQVYSSDSILGMLPPFHSLGLLANIVFPATYGLPMACHANPTEAAMLVRLVDSCKASIIVTPPSFLDAMLKRAKGSDKLFSLRFGFVGAEKCPQPVYDEFAAQCPNGSLCEGYGVTECSPVVSVNRPGKIVPGSIGYPLTSTTVAIAKEDSAHAAHDAHASHNASIAMSKSCEAEPLTAFERATKGAAGLLLVRGPNVFSGYLPPPVGMDYKAPKSPFVEMEGELWYNTGDLVKEDASGLLTFAGRLKRFIKLGGEMVSLPQIEDALLTAFSYLAGSEDKGPFLAVEATGDEVPEIVLAATGNVAKTIGREEANSALRRAGLSGLYSIRRVVPLESIPTLGTGKTNYRELKLMLEKINT